MQKRKSEKNFMCIDCFMYISVIVNLCTLQDYMWQHKQEERELKRIEGDVIKNQRAVRRTLRDYENGSFLKIFLFSDYLLFISSCKFFM